MSKRDNQNSSRQDSSEKPHGRQNVLRVFAACVGCAALLFGGWKLVAYGKDLISAARTARELRNVYHDSPDSSPPSGSEFSSSDVAFHSSQAPQATVSSMPWDDLEKISIPASASPEDAQTSQPVGAATPTPLPWLLNTAYPHNPNLKISSRFQSLRRESKYIIGWLEIPGLIDDAIVQRNNTFFLTHDAKGKENVNGALFLDAEIGLKARPYTYLIYGHNMKSGAMFGGLRNYENTAFYHQTPLITFDTMYEEGKFIVFSVGNISTSSRRSNYLNFSALQSIEIAKRESAIEALQEVSIYSQTIEVTAEDQILLLITCVEDDENRRIVAARRIRENESEEELIRLAKMSWKK